MVARLAESLSVKNLILYHTEDRTLDSRRQRLRQRLFSAGVSLFLMIWNESFFSCIAIASR